MARFAREIVERAGVDVDILIDKLTSAARAELAAFYRHTIAGLQSAGLVDGELREILQDIRTENRNHFDALVARVYELDGRLPEDIHLFAGRVDPGDHGDDAGGRGGDGGDLVAALIESGQRMALTYSDLCEYTAGRDLRTNALARAILNEENEHGAWLHEFLGTGPPGRFRRGFRGRSPYLAWLSPTDTDPA